ncbi:MAG: type I methionyl aminopeptidase [Oscillospiraceae bacterium]|nr:type I methionyl aminopeptidase [Oscillospiraceae bacterium]
MIALKSDREQEGMRKAGELTARARALAGQMVEPGVTTLAIDEEVRKFIEGNGATPSFLNYSGYPKSICISVNDEIIHGIPDEKRVLKEGDIVSVDVGAHLNGFHGDCAATFPCGQVSDEARRLIEVTRQSFFEGLPHARAGGRVSDISHAIQVYAEAAGYSIVRDYVGHGVGRHLHEAPEVPNYGHAGHGPRLDAGMVLAVEPMINVGGWKIKVMPDGWTAKTADGSLSAHYENSILITDGDPEILTRCQEEESSPWI